MAGIQSNETKEWSDDELRDAGWTTEQIATYRLEKLSHPSEEEILQEIKEEE